MPTAKVRVLASVISRKVRLQDTPGEKLKVLKSQENLTCFICPCIKVARLFGDGDIVPVVEASL